MELSNQSAISRFEGTFWRKLLAFQDGTKPSRSPAAGAREIPAPHGFCLEAFGCSDRGSIRPNNEDHVRIEPGLGFYAVADGMGGAEAGEYAARLAVD